MYVMTGSAFSKNIHLTEYEWEWLWQSENGTVSYELDIDLMDACTEIS